MFCAGCDEELAASELPTCRRCAIVCSNVELASGNCVNCRGSKLLFEEARTIGRYEGPLRHAVLKANHSSFEVLAGALRQRLAKAIELSPFEDEPEVVVAVPMHWMKRAWRGTNPAVMVATALARRFDLPMANGALKCVRLLKRQANLTPVERRRNVRGAFECFGALKLPASWCCSWMM
jgi:predicted amidophosphoribosyltransferase